MNLDNCKLLCNHHPKEVTEHFHSLQCPFPVSLCSSAHIEEARTSVFCYIKQFGLFCTSYKWNHLTSFAHQNVCKICPHSHVSLIYSQLLLIIYPNNQQFTHLFSYLWIFELFLAFDFYKLDCFCYSCTSFCGYVFIYLG